MRGRDGTSGVDWSQAAKIGKALLLSPLFGFALAAAAAVHPQDVLEAPRRRCSPSPRATSRRRCGSAAC